MAHELEIVRIPVHPSRARELAQAINAARGGYLAAPACASVDLWVSEAGDEVAAIIDWSSAQAHAQALQDARAAEFFKVVAAFATGAPEVKKYRPSDGGV